MFYAVVAMCAMSFAACNGNAAGEKAVNDSIVVDTTAVDSIEVVDSVAADSAICNE